ncbi:hypothetical protein BDP27DRAFT_1435089 [Rhodocollybia butyracea]|uniref:N-acetyltransferase domain-containing protein n=1 Tax=Rhodocollybia butyracea TaxID=206335 RepID=A0A9P5P2Y5_9AGAR|nr:hypothetical protein BDP27DRAFT_1435089 [Rhodocollybia butyracea]
MPAIFSHPTADSYPVQVVPNDSNLEINAYDLAASIPEYVWDALRQNPVRTNVVLPLAEKARLHEAKTLDDQQLWLTCVSTTESDSKRVDLVLSFSRNTLGDYPLFIVPTVPFSHLTQQFLVPRLQSLMLAIQKFVPRSRVYSVFAPEPVAELFARLWSDSTGIWHYPEPYYAAQLSFCTQRSFKNRQATTMREGSHYNLRPAIPSDLLAVANLCLEFSQGSEPFVLDWEGAVREAEMLIYNKQVWVHEIQSSSDSSSSESSESESTEIACLVAFTRNTRTTATITKVVTSYNHRGLGCAQRLVRQVCKHLLHTGKQSVALYVAHDNIPAGKVYHKVGFVGLNGLEESIEGVERWSEIGFDRTKVQLGHW